MLLEPRTFFGVVSVLYKLLKQYIKKMNPLHYQPWSKWQRAHIIIRAATNIQIYSVHSNIFSYSRINIRLRNIRIFVKPCSDQVFTAPLSVLPSPSLSLSPFTCTVHVFCCELTYYSSYFFCFGSPRYLFRSCMPVVFHLAATLMLTEADIIESSEY